MRSNLNDTIDLMVSKNYKDRFIAEYMQLKDRAEKLENLINRYYNKKLDFKLSCSIRLLKKQLKFMKKYLKILKKRAFIEEIKL